MRQGTRDRRYGRSKRQRNKSIYGAALLLVLLAGCAGAGAFLGTAPLNTPPEFKQKILLKVSEEYQMFQAPRSQYDPGDLQSFHTQHTLPIVIEGAFKELFGSVERLEKGPQLEMGDPDVPAVFEVRLLDLAHDIYNEATSYRSRLLLAVAMKSPRGQIFWQKTFRGEGYTQVDPQFDIGSSGPGLAVQDALRDAMDQMQQAIIRSPEVRLQMRHYQEIQAARQETEKQI